MSQNEKSAEVLQPAPFPADGTAAEVGALLPHSVAAPLCLPESEDIPERLYVLALRLGRALADREG